jgi:hypothetical protein
MEAAVGYNIEALLKGNLLETLFVRAKLQKASRAKDPQMASKSVTGPCLDLLKNPLSAKEQTSRRDNIIALLQKTYGPYKRAQLNDRAFCGLVVRLLDDAFFKGLLLKTIRARGYHLDACSDELCLELVLGGKIGSVHGITNADHARKTIHLFINPIVLDGPVAHMVLSTGRRCRRKRDLMLDTFEHELVHVFVALFCPAFTFKNAPNVPVPALIDPKTGHSNVFANIARVRLGHLDYVTIHGTDETLPLQPKGKAKGKAKAKGKVTTKRAKKKEAP